MASKSSNFRSWLICNDVLIIDRGFRDCIDFFFADHGLIEKMPHFLKNRNELTYEEAYESRLTSVR